jgi:hypothetical protein
MVKLHPKILIEIEISEPTPEPTIEAYFSLTENSPNSKKKKKKKKVVKRGKSTVNKQISTVQ